MRTYVKSVAKTVTLAFLLSLSLWALAPSELNAAEKATPPLGMILQETKDSDSGITKPVLINKTTPKYPEEAKKEGITGDVLIDTYIGTEGETIDPKVTNEVDARLAKSALEALKTWKFKPAVDKNGKAVKVKITLTIRFALK